MNNYYKIGAGASIGGQAGVACIEDYTELKLLPEQGLVDGWEIKHFSLKRGGYTDYLPANIGCRLCSKKLRDILERCKSKKDILQWLDADVVSETGEKRRYYLLHFPVLEDLLDKKKSIYVRNILTKQIIDTNACAGHNVFAYIGGSSLSFVVSQRVREELKNASCSGLLYIQISPKQKSFLPNIIHKLWNKAQDNIEGANISSTPNVNMENLERLRLPHELIDFFGQNNRLHYDEGKCTVGHVELVSIQSLLLGRIYVESNDNSKKDECHTIPAVDLIAECEGFDAWGILIWLPDMQKFGTWDIDHRVLRVFPKAKWTEIVKDPVKYLNTLWEPEKVENIIYMPPALGNNSSGLKSK